ncbi:MAG: hypothetical protein FWD59_04065 [Micrococcales bacterium]|nr:hypothetical protein [Micrococcales bacterium]
MSRTTIAIQTDTRARISAAAAAEETTIDGLLRQLLDQRDRRRFWESFEHVTPQSYAAALAADGDDLDEGFATEDRGLDAEEAEW